MGDRPLSHSLLHILCHGNHSGEFLVQSRLDQRDGQALGESKESPTNGRQSYYKGWSPVWTEWIFQPDAPERQQSICPFVLSLNVTPRLAVDCGT
jgi:hypothetical protein